MSAQLLGLSTALPPHRLDQDVVTEAAAAAFANSDDFRRLRPVFANTGIRTRWSARPLDWFQQDQDWGSRNDAFLEAGTELFVRAGREALAKAGLEADQVDTVVTVSSTGIATPSLEARAAGALGLRADVRRVPVFGLGCAGGVTGLALAARLAEADPGSNVLLVVVELCTLAFRADSMDKSNIVATALFGDGAAACVVSTAGAGLAEIRHRAEHSWPDTLDVMGWDIDPVGFSAIFSRSIPDLVSEHMRPVTDRFLAECGMSLADVDVFTIHPGGTKVIAALEESLELEDGRLGRERAVLRDCGNMSAPTVLFVLDRALSEGASGRGFASALGPGFTVSMLQYDL